jgi:hypothetical protein
MRINELFEAGGKTAAVAFGRMNPPTIGHQKVVEAILKQKADVHFLFVSQTHKPVGKNKTRYENPLPFDVKLGFIQQAFPNIDIGDTSVSTAIGILQHLEKQGFENVIFVCGSDRVPSFTELFNKQNGIDYNLKSIKIVSSGARDPDAEGAEGMSASKMRAAAIANDFESFKTGLPAGLQGDAEQVFSAVRQGLEPWLEQGVSEKFDPRKMKSSNDTDVRTVGAGAVRVPSGASRQIWNEPTWSFQEIAQKLGIPTSALNLLAFKRIGGFPEAVSGLSSKYGGSKFYKQSEVKRWVNANNVREKLKQK